MAAANVLGTRRYQKLAEWVRRRDHGQCQICGSPGRTVDHIRPRHLGGGVFDHTNMRTLCQLCNQIKGGSLMSDADVLAARRLRGDDVPRPRSTGPSSIITRDYTRRDP